MKSSKHEIAAVVEFLKSIDSQNYTARELMRMIEERNNLTYQMTPPRIRHRMMAYDLPYKCITRNASKLEGIIFLENH